MTMNILHRTTYCYVQPVMFQPRPLMVTPRSGHDLRTLTATLTTSPQRTLDWRQDVFAEPASELVITSEVTVDQTAVPYPIFGIAPYAHSYPFNDAVDGRVDLGAMLLAGTESDQWRGPFRPFRPTLQTPSEADCAIG